MPSARKAVADPEGWVSLPVASRMLRVSRQTTLTMALRGELDAQHIAGRTVISRDSIEKALAAKGAA